MEEEKNQKTAFMRCIKASKKSKKNKRALLRTQFFLMHLLYIYAPPTVHAFLTRHVSGKT
jgi:hypothetical protein